MPRFCRWGPSICRVISLLLFISSALCLSGEAPKRVLKQDIRRRRFRARIAYDGLHFHGWAKIGKQKNVDSQDDPLRTVTGALEAALQDCLGQKVRVFGSGRTDSGVSATGQVCSWDCILSKASPTAPRLPNKLRGQERANVRLAALAEENGCAMVDIFGNPTPIESLPAMFNAALPLDVRIVSTELVSETFCPINNSLWKRYRYSFPCGDADFDLRRSVLWHHLERNLPLPRKTDGSDRIPGPEPSLVPELSQIEDMKIAARCLEGTHDFKGLQAAGGRSSTVRKIYRCQVEVDETTGCLAIVVEGSGFLYRQVRIIAGTLAAVGMGLLPPDAIDHILLSGDRAAAGTVLAAEHLCLEHVEYDLTWEESHPRFDRHGNLSLGLLDGQEV